MAKTILMVDDERDLVFATRLCLEGAGYTVEAAYDGAEALEQIAKVKPDLVLLDVYMPAKNGWEVLKELKADPETRDIPVIMLTAAVEPENIARGFAHDCTWYHTKPFDPKDLMTVIERVFNASDDDLLDDPT
jgi:two-component system alkaline phosphatase synthesis response regulator PhoP